MLDVKITLQEQAFYTEVFIKHDGLYARAWESFYEKLIVDNDQDATSPLHPREVTVESGHTIVKTCTTPVTTGESFRESFPQQMDYVTERIRTTTWNLMQKRVRNNLTFTLNTTNPRSTKHFTIPRVIVTTNVDTKQSIYLSLFYGTHTYTFQKSQEIVTEPIRSNSRVSSYFFVDTPCRLHFLSLSRVSFKNTATIADFRFLHETDIRLNYIFVFY